MEKSFKEKLKTWLQPHPVAKSAVQTAAIALNLKAKLLSDEHEMANQDAQAVVLTCLDSIVTYLHLCEHDPKQRKGNKVFLQIQKISHNYLRAAQNGHLNGMAVAQEFNAATSPEKRNFVRRAQSLAKKLDCGFEDLNYTINAGIMAGRFPGSKISVLTAVRENLLNQTRHLGATLNTCEHELFTSHAYDITNPKDGPRSTREIMTMFAGYALSVQYAEQTGLKSPLTKPSEGLMTNPIIRDTMQALDEVDTDLPVEQRQKMLKEDLEVLAELSETHFYDVGQLITYLHFYLSHSEEKLTASNYAALDECLTQLRIWNFNEMIVDNPEFVSDPSPEAIQKWFDDVYARYTPDYPKPSPDEIMKDMERAVAKKFAQSTRNRENTIGKLRDARAQIPDSMEEVSLLYYQESEQTRNLRKGIFKAKTRYDGSDGPKAAFIKKLARTHVQELLDIGLIFPEIATMSKTGKLPANSGLTIEHIIDREVGGTNHEDNFILMPEEINKQKDLLKAAQIRNTPNAEQGCWMVSWVPKKNADGTYPKIFTHAANDNRPAPQAQELSYMQRLANTLGLG